MYGKVGYSRHFFAFTITATLFQVQRSSKFVTQQSNSIYTISCQNMKATPFRKNFAINLSSVPLHGVHQTGQKELGCMHCIMFMWYPM